MARSTKHVPNRQLDCSVGEVEPRTNLEPRSLSHVPPVVAGKDIFQGSPSGESVLLIRGS